MIGRIWSSASFALPKSSGWVRLPTGCGTTAQRMPGAPANFATPLRAPVNALVDTRTFGMPFFSNAMLASRPPELHPPQSPMARMATSTRRRSSRTCEPFARKTVPSSSGTNSLMW